MAKRYTCDVCGEEYIPERSGPGLTVEFLTWSAHEYGEVVFGANIIREGTKLKKVSDIIDLCNDCVPPRRSAYMITNSIKQVIKDIKNNENN